MLRAYFFLFAMHALQANGQFLNQINTPSEEGTYGFKNILSNTHLFYVSENGEADMLWSMDLQSKTKTSLLELPNNRIQRPFILLDNRVYFSMEVNNSKPMLWSTDGTKEGTSQVSEVALNGAITTSNGQLFSSNQQNQLVQLKNSEISVHPIRVPRSFSICAFNESHFIVQTQEQSGNDYQLKRYLVGELSDVFEYSSSFESNTSNFLFDNRCYFTVVNGLLDDPLVPSTIITLGEQGVAEEFHPQTGIPTIVWLFPHHNRLYALAGEDDLYNGIYRFKENIEGYDAQYILGGGSEFGFAFSTNQLITASTKSDDDVFATSLTFFDSDLNFVPSYPYSSDYLLANSNATQTKVIAGFDKDNKTTIIQEFDSQNNLTITQIENFRFTQVITNPNIDDSFVVLGPPSAQPKIYSINEKPILNDLINGTWHDPQVPNQGLVVQKGRRNDGSEYVFTTLYTYDQGEPLWLAGVSDLKAEQQQLFISLFQYDGPQLFEYNITPNQEFFGELTLELLNCEQLKLTVNSEVYNKSLNLLRIDDTSFNHLCADISYLSLNQLNETSPGKKELTHE